jgi:endonuclease/exonuclease/phosphatase (EEP) superfamily protein YafD
MIARSATTSCSRFGRTEDGGEGELGPETDAGARDGSAGVGHNLRALGPALAFDLFSHFRLQYVVAALAFCIAALAVRACRTAALLALVALVHGWSIEHLWLGGRTEVAPSGVAIRVASANVRNGNRTPEKVLDFIRASDADVVVLVDARDTQWRKILAQIGTLYPYRAPEGWRDGGRVVLFSRYRILQDEVVHPPAGRRPYLVTEMAMAGRRFSVVGVHPSSPSPHDPSESRRRNRQLSHIASSVQASDRPVIVAGDFNTSPWSPHFSDLLCATGLRNAAEGYGYIATWPSCCSPAQIPLDHVLLKGPLAVTSMRRGPSIGSDHYPIIADLRLEAG